MHVPELKIPFKEGDQFHDYRILKYSGIGAYGVVFIAQDLMGKNVALKIISTSISGLYHEREINGLREYRTKITYHPNLMQIFHIGTTDGFLYYTMECADNLSNDPAEYIPDTLKNRIQKNGIGSLSDVYNLGINLLHGIRCLHENQLIHRDIKPDNIIYVNGTPKLSDIGLISAAVKNISFAGTVGFFPPEFFSSGKNIEYDIDFYALGKVLYIYLTGAMVENYPVFPPASSLNCKNLRHVILHACSESRQERYSSARDFEFALETAYFLDANIQKTRNEMEQGSDISPTDIHSGISSVTELLDSSEERMKKNYRAWDACCIWVLFPIVTVFSCFFYPALLNILTVFFGSSLLLAIIYFSRKILIKNSMLNNAVSKFMLITNDSNSRTAGILQLENEQLHSKLASDILKEISKRG